MTDLSDMIQGVLRWIEGETDRVMQITSWQTALLMNATGNYKTAVKPEKLYEPLYTEKQKKSKGTNKADIERKKEELKNLFGLDEGSSS